MRRRDLLGAISLGIAGAAGCLGDTDASAPDIADATLVVVATTSVYDTGIMDPLTSGFEERFGVSVDIISQGTGAALETARRGDCDVVMMHAPEPEETFLREGHGINRRAVMASPFVVVGPEDDPAGIADTGDVTDAFRSVAAAESTFISRADQSGTHFREREIWAAAEIEPGGAWYHESGTGMGNALIQADELDGYVLTVRATWLAMESALGLAVVLDAPPGDPPPLLANRYRLAAVNPARHSNVAYDLAMAYLGYLTSPEGQGSIAAYTVDGEQLFFPVALEETPDADRSA